MKSTLACLACLVFCTNAVNAQMDDQFYFPGKVLKAIDSVNYEEVSIPVDTARVTGIFLKPATTPKATILFFHGAGGNVTSYLFMTRPLVEDGFQVFMVDFRGYGKSTGNPTHLNIASDGQVVFDYLLKRQDVKGTKLIIYGASMGTQVAVHLARLNLQKVSALVTDGTISSFTDVAADHSPAAQRDMILKNLSSPYAAREDIKSLDKLPKLFIHSREDKDVPFEEGELVYKLAPEPKKLLIYKGGHLQAMVADRAGVLKAINSLLQK